MLLSFGIMRSLGGAFCKACPCSLCWDVHALWVLPASEGAGAGLRIQQLLVGGTQGAGGDVWGTPSPCTLAGFSPGDKKSRKELSVASFSQAKGRVLPLRAQ